MKAQQQWELWSIPNNSPTASTRASCIVVFGYAFMLGYETR